MATGDVLSTARRMWLLAETIHALIYFAPEHRRAQDALGLKGGWMAYFASRSAPLGAVPAPVVTALFYNFAPRMVARALPDAWRYATPARVLEARYAAGGRALDRIVAPDLRGSTLDDALELLGEAVGGCQAGGRPMFAANAALSWPQDPLTALWHATTLLREHRGDGHVAALLSHELDGCEAHIMAAARGRTTVAQLQPHRGWTDEQWQAATQRLRARGLLASDGACTDRGHELHAAVEEATDRLASAPWDHLGPDRTARLAELLQPLADAVAASGVLPYPNPMGLPALHGGGR